jgi:LEA14-like dessication related protein
MQKNIWKIAALCAMLSPVAALPSVVAQEQKQEEKQETTLTVVAGNGIVNEGPMVGKLDMGAVDALVTPKIERDFVLRNNGKAPITIGRLQATCGCTSVLLGEKNETTKTLAPGEEIKVRAAVDVTRFRGPIHKAVRAYAPDQITLLASMEIIADIREPVTFSTRQLNFGRVNFGTGATLPLEVTLSPKLLDKNTVLKLVSSNPALEVMPADKEATSATSATNTRHYVVKVSPQAPIGFLGATLNFEAAPAAAGTPIDENLQAVLRLAVVSIAGEVAGKIAAMPNLVILGARDAKQQITVSGAEAKQLKVNSTSAHVVTKWLSAKEKSAAQLEISLSPKTPAGTLEAQIVITADSGETLRLPLIADVAAAK